MGNETKTFEERFNEEAEQVAANLAEGKAAIDNTETAEQVKEVEAPKTEVAETVENTETVEVPEVGKAPVQEKTWEEVKAEFEEQERERIEKEEYEEWKRDKFAQDYRKAKKQGVDVKAFVNSIADIDVSLISEETLFKNSLAGKNLSESDLDDEWREFKDQKDFIKEAYLEKERNKITSQIEEKRKDYKGNLVIQNPDEVYSEARIGLDNFLKSAIGSKHKGVVVTSKMALDVMKLAPKYFVTSMKNGKVDVTDAFDTAFAKLASTEWHEDLIEQGKTQGLETAFAAKHNPNAASMVSSQKTKEMTKEQKEEAAWKEKFAKANSTLLTDK